MAENDDNEGVVATTPLPRRPPWGWGKVEREILGSDIRRYEAPFTIRGSQNPFRDRVGPSCFAPFSARQNDWAEGQPRLEIDREGDYLDNTDVRTASQDRGVEILPPPLLGVPGPNLSTPHPEPFAGSWGKVEREILGSDMRRYEAPFTLRGSQNPFRDRVGPSCFTPFSARQNDWAEGQPRLEIDREGDYLDNADVRTASQDRGVEVLPPPLLGVPGPNLGPPHPEPFADWMEAGYSPMDFNDEEPPPTLEIPGPSNPSLALQPGPRIAGRMELVDGLRQFNNVCGFRPHSDEAERIHGHLSVPDIGHFAPEIMDIIISDRSFFTKDALGSFKPSSHVRFNTRALEIAPIEGDMVLRVGRLYRSRGNTGRVQFHITPCMDLFELTDNSTWEPTSSLRIPGPKTEDLIPWQYSSDTPTPGDELSPVDHYFHEPTALASCVLLRRKSQGDHNHHCQKLDWYPPQTPETMRRFLKEDDFLLRFGVENLLIANPSNRYSPEVYGCAELFKFEHLIGTGACNWIYLGRDECWLKDVYDIGLVRRYIVPEVSFSEFAEVHQRPKAWIMS